MMRGHFDWQANSNGRKYLSASMKLVLDLIGGKVLELDLLSPGGGLQNKIKDVDQSNWIGADNHYNICIKLSTKYAD